MKAAAGLSVVLLTVAACATRPATVVADPSPSGQVGVQDITVAALASGRLQLASNETFLPATEEPDNAVPEYPEPLLVQRLPPQVVCLRVSVGTDGAVMSTAPITGSTDSPQCAATHSVDPAFYASAAQAASMWRFSPALRCVFPDAKSRSDTGCWGGKGVLQPVSLAYRFVFEQHDGRGSVQMTQ